VIEQGDVHISPGFGGDQSVFTEELWTHLDKGYVSKRVGRNSVSPYPDVTSLSLSFVEGVTTMRQVFPWMRISVAQNAK
jgi:hypothetical protein